MEANASKSKKIVPKNNDKFSSARKLLVSNIEKAMKKANNRSIFPYEGYMFRNICLYNESHKNKLLIVVQALGQEYRLLSYRESGFNWTFGGNKGKVVGYNSPKEFFTGNRIVTSNQTIATGNKRKLVANLHVRYNKKDLLEIPIEQVAINSSADRKHDRCFIEEIKMGIKDYSWFVEIPNEAIEYLASNR